MIHNIHEKAFLVFSVIALKSIVIKKLNSCLIFYYNGRGIFCLAILLINLLIDNTDFHLIPVDPQHQSKGFHL